MPLELTSKEVILAAIFSIIAIAFNNAYFLSWLNGLTPIYGFMIYEAAVFIVLFLLTKAELVYHGMAYESPFQALGVWLLVSAFFICFNWTSPYDQYAVTGSFDGVNNIYVNNSEDGVVWWLWYDVVGVKDVGLCWWLAYPVTVFSMALAGGFLTFRAEI